MTADQLLNILGRYLEQFPAESDKFHLLFEQLQADEIMDDRRNFRGHITGSGLVLSPDQTKVLLIHHKGSGNWQQPGGHWEPDEPDPLSAARREVIEETGTVISEYIPGHPKHPLVPLDIDTHYIPARPEKSESEHYHHDFLYLFIAANEATVFQEEEVYGAAWFAFDAPECASPKMQRVLGKALQAA